MKYPGITVDYGSRLGRGCWIACSDDSTMVLREVAVAQNVVLMADLGGQIIIERAYIGPGSVIASAAKVEIGEHSEIAEMVVIRDQNHRFGNNEPLAESGIDKAPIKIGRNVWIGAKATILKGTEIGDNAVVGAHSLVNRSLPAGKVAVGIPARVIDSEPQA